MSHRPGAPGSVPLNEAWDSAVEAGFLDDPAAALAKLRDKSRPTYDALDSWLHGAAERSLECYEAGVYPSDEDSQRMQALAAIAGEAAQRRNEQG